MSDPAAATPAPAPQRGTGFQPVAEGSPPGDHGLEIHATTLPYESIARPTPMTSAHLVGEWFRWASLAVALDVVPFAMMWGTSHDWISARHLRGRPLVIIGFVLGGIALVAVVRLIRLAVRTRGIEQGSYVFLAIINFKAGLFACALLAILSRF